MMAIKRFRVFLREVSMVPIYPMVLFGGTGIEVVLQRGKFVLSMEGGVHERQALVYQLEKISNAKRFIYLQRQGL